MKGYLAACPCGVRGKQIERWPRYNSRHYFYVIESEGTHHTVESMWSDAERRMIGRHVESHSMASCEDGVDNHSSIDTQPPI